MLQNEKLACPFCKANKAGQIRKNGSYTVKNNSDDSDGVIIRYQCKNCGEGFTAHTNITPIWNHGFTKRTKRLTRKMKPLSDFDERNVGPEFRKEKSHHNQRIENAIFKKIDTLIIEKGFLRITKIKSELKMGVATYYRYMETLKRRTFWKNDIEVVRSHASMNRLILLELKTKIYPTPEKDRKRKDIIKVFILFDKETHLAYDFFLITKQKKRRSFLNFGNQYTAPELVNYLKNLKNRFPKLLIEVDCENRTKEYLLKKAPELFNPSARYFASFWKDLEKYRMRKTLSFGWTISEKKVAKRKKSLVKELGEQKAEMVWNPISPISELRINLNLLLSIYNQHHLVRLTKMTEASRSS